MIQKRMHQAARVATLKETSVDTDKGHAVSSSMYLLKLLEPPSGNRPRLIWPSAYQDAVLCPLTGILMTKGTTGRISMVVIGQGIAYESFQGGRLFVQKHDEAGKPSVIDCWDLTTGKRACSGEAETDGW
jgi:hypothetical protein